MYCVLSLAWLLELIPPPCSLPKPSPKLNPHLNPNPHSNHNLSANPSLSPTMTMPWQVRLMAAVTLLVEFSDTGKTHTTTNIQAQPLPKP